MSSLSLAPPVCNWHISGIDYRCNAEKEACCESLDDVAYWLASNDFTWSGAGFLRRASGNHGKSLYARILRGGGCGPALTIDEQRTLILPLVARDFAVV